MVTERLVRGLLGRAGIRVDGSEPWDISVRNPSFYREVVARGSLGLGESYMNRLWECRRIDQFMARLLSSSVSLAGWVNPVAIRRWLRDVLLNAPRRDPYRIGRDHYDKGNDLYASMLDSSLTYSCGYWDGGAVDLGAAQSAKLDLVCRKLELQPGQRVLDIGCGWGSLARLASERYGVEVVGLTVSQEQAAYARQRCAGLPVTIECRDFREIGDRKFDAVASIGMFEHVEPKNYGAYFAAVRSALSTGGRFLLHTISKPQMWNWSDPWIRKYIFPLGRIPAQRQLMAAATRIFSHVLDIHDLGGANYDRTLMQWYRNFSERWKGKSGSTDEPLFKRMWEYYLLTCAGAFRAGTMTVWQVLLSDRPGSDRPVPAR